MNQLMGKNHGCEQWLLKSDVVFVLEIHGHGYAAQINKRIELW